MSISRITATPKKLKKKLSISRKYSNYTFGFFLAVSLPLFSVAGLNWLVDPYDVFNTPNFLGLNHQKPKKDNSDRLFKAVDIIRIKPKVIIIGSSRTKQGIDPGHLNLADPESAYNLAINGPNMYEVLRYLEHAVKNQPDIQEIILGVDFFMFNATLNNQPTFSEERLEKTHIVVSDAINALFSLDTLTASRETIVASLNTPNGDNSYGENGFMPNRSLDSSTSQWRFEGGIKLYFRLHSDYQFSQEYLADFQKIVQLCQENNIKLTVFISPSHATQWEAIRATNQWSTWEQWKREMVKMVPVWDFSGYNSVTTEKISEDMNNYADNSHYTPNIGNLILDRMFNYQSETLPEAFGVLLTPENIEDNLAKIRKQRQEWANNNPQEIELVEKLQQQVEMEE